MITKRQIQNEVFELNLFFLFSCAVVDAARVGSRAKYINHSSSPSCVVKVIIVNGDHRITIVGKKYINPGEELTFDYGYNHTYHGSTIQREYFRNNF